jgi:hypothetical protein
MKARTQLLAWLADEAAQRRSLDAVDECARKWSLQPLMTQLEWELSQLPDEEPQAVLAAAARFMDRVDDISALICELIASSRSDPFFSPHLHAMSSEIHTGLLLFHNRHLSIAVGVSGLDMLAAKKSGKRGATSVGFTGLLSMYRYLKAGDATISLWEAPPIGPEFVASQAGSCRRTGTRKLRDGEDLIIDGRYQSFVIEHAASDMIYFQAMVRTAAAPLTLEYDSKTMAFVGASSTDEASSRVQMMVSLLRTMEREDALPLIEEALNSPHFYTRWHIMREFLALDADAALPALRRMATGDPHPEVRAAAEQTLGLFFEEDARDAAPASGEGVVQCRA